MQSLSMSPSQSLHELLPHDARCVARGSGDATRMKGEGQSTSGWRVGQISFNSWFQHRGGGREERGRGRGRGEERARGRNQVGARQSRRGWSPPFEILGELVERMRATVLRRLHTLLNRSLVHKVVEQDGSDFLSQVPSCPRNLTPWARANPSRKIHLAHLHAACQCRPSLITASAKRGFTARSQEGGWAYNSQRTPGSLEVGERAQKVKMGEPGGHRVRLRHARDRCGVRAGRAVKRYD